MDVSHDAESRTFSLPTEAGPAYLTYAKPEEGTMDLIHTVVPGAVQNQGVGSRLVEHVFRLAREEGICLVPSCRFVQSWLEEHPEFRDVVDDSG
jgi:uncharacterized protein